MTTYTLEELQRMPTQRRNELLLRATKIEATVVVRDAQGRRKYDDPTLAGSYREENLDASKPRPV